MNILVIWNKETYCFEPESVIFIEKSYAFGYLPNGEVNSQYNKCMMNGEFDQICEYLCAEADDAEEKSNNEDFETLEQQCDKCRGINLIMSSSSCLGKKQRK